MFYRVFFDPDVVRPAYEAGEIGVSLLLGIWKGFLLNCSICEVDGYLVHDRLGEVLREIGNDAEAANNGLSDYVTRLKKILVQMEKQNRFVDVLSTSKADQSLPLLALLSAKSIGLDFILTDHKMPDDPKVPERAGFRAYALSNFERERSKQVDDGLIPEGEDTDEEFFPKRFGKLLPLAKRAVIVDAILGRKFGDNFQFTLKRLIEYLEINHHSPADLIIEIHTEDSARVALLEHRLGEWCKTIQFKVHRHSEVTHERYLFTDQFGLQLGIGMDLLDRQTKRNRGTDFSYARISKLNDLIPSAM
jgi:hypothetical protein